jgi:phosphohistidine phosphatase
MTIYLIRHAHALEGEDDAARPLSKRGRTQVRQMGRFLRRTGSLASGEFWHSPLVRARDTAGLLAKKLKRRIKLVEVKGLLHSDNPAVMAKRLGRVRRPVAVVGHEPHLGALLSLLVTGSARPARFELDKSAVAALERTKNRWTLRWLATPRLIKRR